MRIKTLTLYSNDLESQKSFYQHTLGFNLAEETNDFFSVDIGWTKLTFKKSDETHHYHYCFLIPANKLDETYKWFEGRMDIIKNSETSIFSFEDWNARSFYFYDGNRNLAECIVRYDLTFESGGDFTINDLLCINEIGSPTKNIQKTNQMLESSIGSHFWKGDDYRFGTNGNQEGLLLLVNPVEKKFWFPADDPIIPSPYKAEIETNKGSFDLVYYKENLSALKKS